MANYKLTYFNIKGIAEPIRFLLSYAGLEFIDERITEDSWIKLKSSKYKLTKTMYDFCSSLAYFYLNIWGQVKL